MRIPLDYLNKFKWTLDYLNKFKLRKEGRKEGRKDGIAPTSRDGVRRGGPPSRATCPRRKARGGGGRGGLPGPLPPRSMPTPAGGFEGPPRARPPDV